VCADSRVGIEKRERGKGKNKKKKKERRSESRIANEKLSVSAKFQRPRSALPRNFGRFIDRRDCHRPRNVTGRVMSPGVTLYTKGERAFWTGTLGYSSSIKTEKSKIRGNRNAIACAHSASRAAEWGGGRARRVGGGRARRVIIKYAG